MHSKEWHALARSELFSGARRAAFARPLKGSSEINSCREREMSGTSVYSLVVVFRKEIWDEDKESIVYVAIICAGYFHDCVRGSGV